MQPMNSSMSMPMTGGLDPSQFDLSNETQASDFLSQLLDDSTLQYDAQSFSRYFWYGIVGRRAAAKNHPKPAAPTSLLGQCATVASDIWRTLTYPQFTPATAKSWIQVPSVGTMMLLLLYFSFLLALEFINNNVRGAQYWTSLAIRAGWLAIAQVPLLILLAGKNNLIGFVTGLSYARLNVLHRWVARAIFLMAILHMSIWNYSWNKYGIRSLEWSTDSCVPTGSAAFALLAWLNISTLAPCRALAFELFVFQHLLTFFGFIIAIMYHLPSTALETRTYIWISIGLYLFDRSVRTIRLIWNNTRQVRATVEPLVDGVTRIRVKGSRVRKWTPGSFVLLSIPRYGFLQSHPATIASTPTSHGGDMVFLLRAHKGFTKNLIGSAFPAKSTLGPASKVEQPQASKATHRAFIDGPYGDMRADLVAFDTVLLVAGSTGITFTLAVMLDMSARSGHQKLPLRRVDLVWAVKQWRHTRWVADELRTAFLGLQKAGIETSLRLFVTCDSHVTDSVDCSFPEGCQCDPHGPKGQPCHCEVRSSTVRPEVALQEQAIAADEPWTIIQSGRPSIDAIVANLMPQAQGEIGVAVCGPLGLRNATSRAVVKSMNAKQGIYLHVEGFSL